MTDGEHTHMVKKLASKEAQRCALQWWYRLIHHPDKPEPVAHFDEDWHRLWLEFEQWLAAAPEHQAAYDQLEAGWQHLWPVSERVN